MIKIDNIKESVIERKEQIIKKATVLFYENGYDNTSIRELSKAADISVAGVYYFFKDKEEILFDILYESVINLINAIKDSIYEKNDPKINVKRIIENLLKHVIKHKMEIIILNREDGRLNSEQKVIIKQKNNEAFTLVKKELNKLEEPANIKTRNITLAAFMIFAMTTWIVKWYDPNGPLKLEEIAEEMINIFFNGILSN